MIVCPGTSPESLLWIIEKRSCGNRYDNASLNYFPLKKFRKLRCFYLPIIVGRRAADGAFAAIFLDAVSIIIRREILYLSPLV